MFILRAMANSALGKLSSLAAAASNLPPEGLSELHSYADLLCQGMSGLLLQQGDWSRLDVRQATGSSRLQGQAVPVSAVQ